MTIAGPCRLQLFNSIQFLYGTHRFAIWNYFISVRQLRKWSIFRVIFQNRVRLKCRDFSVQVILLSVSHGTKETNFPT